MRLVYATRGAEHCSSSYSITMLARRITALEALPSAQRPLRITGGLPRDYVPPKASPAALPKKDSVTNEPKATEPYDTRSARNA